MSAKFWKLKKADNGTTFISGTDHTNRSEQSAAGSIDLVPGALIGGVYRIVTLIGRGGMGEVYLARHETLGKKCALKVIPPEQVSEMGWQRFQLEAKAVAKLEHINLVRVTDLGIHEGCLPFYAMDYIDGNTLAEILSQSGPMPVARVLEIFMQVCDGVDCAHQSGLLHRDLKPANIMVLEQKSGHPLAKILDFGLAKLTGQDRDKQSLTAVGDVFGSPFYMSPEQCNGDKLDRRSDIYSLGCTMFECLTGQPPFTGHLAAAVIFSQLEADPPSLESIVGSNKLPVSMEIVIAKLLRKNPVERYQTLPELRGDLERVARGEEVQPFYVSRSKRTEIDVPANAPARSYDHGKRSERNNKILLPLFAIAFLILISSASFWYVNSRPKQRTNAETVSAYKMPDVTIGNDLGYERSIGTIEEERPDSLALSSAPPTSAKDTKPYSRVLEQGGHKKRIFYFPDEFPVGDLEIYDREDMRHKIIAAKGEVALNPDVLVDFTPREIAWKYPNYLRRFRSGDLYGVKIVDDAYTSGSDKKLNGSIARALDLISEIPGVQSLHLLDVGRSQSSEELAPLEKFPSLKHLHITWSGAEAKKLSELSMLQKLESLDIWINGDFTEILQSLKTSTQISALALRSDTTLSEIAMIANLPNLRELELIRVNPANQNVTIEILNLLSKAARLESLKLDCMPIGVDAASTLSQFKNLKHLKLDSQCVLPQIARRLERALPSRITIEFGTEHTSF
ncbi:MAG: protein kinase [Cyanobacteria bacterium REEB67]|nr:protein kinase [Cyanobacteria bacterium REEB67]